MDDASTGTGTGISVPVFLHDGEREIYVGTAVVHPFLKFHDLQSGISQRVGLSPHQISIYSAERRPYRSWPRKTLVNAKFDFRSITGSDGVYFLVFLRRSGPLEKARGGAGKRRFPENMMLLRRGSVPAGYMDPYEYDRGVRLALAEMGMESMKNRPRHYASMNGRDYVFCNECEKAKEPEFESEPEFHLCPNDAVVVGIRTSASPVARPAKR